MSAGTNLGDKIAACLYDTNATTESKAAVKELWEKIGDVILDFIADNAKVTIQSGIPVSTSGTAISQTGATTGTGQGNISFS